MSSPVGTRNVRPRSPAAGVVLLGCWVALGAGCGRRLLGHLPVDLPPDAGSGGSAGAGGARHDASAVDTATGDALADAGVAPDTGAADGGAPDGPPVQLPQACTSDGWCWTHPLPTSDRFVRAFDVGADDLWLI